MGHGPPGTGQYAVRPEWAPSNCCVRRRCHIAVGTPGRVGSLLETGVLQPGMMRMLVLDEADQLMTESFAEDVRCAASGKQQELVPGLAPL